MMRWTRSALCALAMVSVTGCAVSPYDFPVPTMVGDRQGYSMTGYMATAEEAEVRRRLEKRMRCPAGVAFPSLKTSRADNGLGTKILQYEAVMMCKAPPPE